MKKSLLTLALTASLLVPTTGCMPKVPTPYFATTPQLIGLLPGMNFREVRAALGIDPYDVYLSTAEGLTIAVWHYKHPGRLLPANQANMSEFGATGGTELLRDLDKVYIVFDNGIMASFIVEDALNGHDMPPDTMYYFRLIEAVRNGTSDYESSLIDGSSEYDSSLTDESIEHDSSLTDESTEQLAQAPTQKRGFFGKFFDFVRGR